ncbi:hypothetical protein J3A78_003513 [Streptomyces sp. PvR006]|uniref:hypothetical protein n=1 Tax=Streptomyces sp. PvR006 TaxID=2817860 RepID=UPI001AE9C523|nr:hypothetical protein [Streptomyces sp. PvR006]MBP2583035.1 hypothetical protein [Streptomyces sp. PvR006]
MHDPLTVAFEIRRPWPQPSPLPSTSDASARWRIRLHHDCGTWCADEPPHREGARPWWKPSSYSPFWRLNGRDYYWPSWVTVWHREPKGHDGLSVCGRRVQRRDGTWRFARSWRWHVHHYKIQLCFYQNLRRRLLTRCSWCGGRSVKGDQVNVSHSWDGPRGRWWQGEKGLFHGDCSSVSCAHSTCVCEAPELGGRTYGKCAACALFRPFGISAAALAHNRDLQAVPRGGRRTNMEVDA